MGKIRFLIRQTLYDLEASLLFRPGLITFGLGTAGVVLSVAEARVPEVAAATRPLRWIVPTEPAAAQLVLATIAGALTTVLSIVYSVLLVALSLTSVQFSPRVLTGFMRDSVSRNTLGLFIGTFTYAILVLRAVRSEPEPFVPPISVAGGFVLALVGLAYLLYFIHHMAQSIQVNYIVDRIAVETELVIDQVFPPRGDGEPGDAEVRAPEPPPDAHTVPAPASGYVQLLDAAALLEAAQAHGVTLYVHRAVGQFLVEGGPLVHVVPASRATSALAQRCVDAFDIGPVRTMQDDVEYGIRQIVDVALKAISPAVNDPSTAVTCVDHLGRLLCRIARRGAGSWLLSDPATGELRVALAPTDFRRAIELSFNQLRQYGRGDMALLLRMTRALDEVARAAAGRKSHLELVRRHLRLVAEHASAFSAEDRIELDRRIAAAARAAGGSPDQAAAAAALAAPPPSV